MKGKMKKITLNILIIVLLLSFISCSKTLSNNESKKNSDQVAITTTVQATTIKDLQANKEYELIEVDYLGEVITLDIDDTIVNTLKKAQNNKQNNKVEEAFIGDLYITDKNGNRYIYGKYIVDTKGNKYIKPNSNNNYYCIKK